MRAQSILQLAKARFACKIALKALLPVALERAQSILQLAKARFACKIALKALE